MFLQIIFAKDDASLVDLIAELWHNRIGSPTPRRAFSPEVLLAS